MTSFAQKKLPTVDILATGGTIAGVASSGTSTVYAAGSISGRQLVASVPGLDKLANIETEQVYNKDSGNITLDDWRKLATAVDRAGADPKVDAIVITHGTDTLAETSYFLDLVVKTTKPIVIVGSMRAATSISADGPMNLYNAVAVAINPATQGRGVLVVMNDHIFDGRDVTKTNTTNVDTFQSPNLGPVGEVLMGNVRYLGKNLKLNTVNTPFNLPAAGQSFPNVAILYAYVGMDVAMLERVLETPGLQGIVFAGVGDGNLPDYIGNFLIKARKMGIVIVRSNRTGSGFVSYDYNNLDTTFGLLTARDLNPEKARVLLMLSMMKTHDMKTIAHYFSTY